MDMATGTGDDPYARAGELAGRIGHKCYALARRVKRPTDDADTTVRAAMSI